VNGTRAIAVVVVATSLAACGQGPSDLGSSPDILWWTDHETGDLNDWTRNGGSLWTIAGGELSVVTSPVRSGNYALRSSVTSSSTMLSEAVAQRAGVQVPVDAYYSAWYYVPAASIPDTYWLFFKFRSRCVASDPSSGAEVWDFNFVPDGNGGMQFALFGHVKGVDEPQVNAPAVPIGQWFQVEAFLRVANDDTGRLTVWENDTVIFDVQGRPTMPSSCVEWSVGGIAGVITPASATFYVDDAAISTRRLGPTYPIFWRGN
jgi:hypothetical protein